ncbi:ATP-binding protein [Rubrivirga sp. IMCC43871]|uniref:ATP-binding protein n=1 Tax=Rubrivirga sp. IMCC43871 TaxID=3391575 RepID=UPI00398FE4CF
MARYPSVDVALDALQARITELERDLAAARRGGDVEAALDRVWTRALDVQHSDETLGVAVAVFDALRGLGLPVVQISLSGRPDRDASEAPAWTAGVDADGAARANHHVTATTGLALLDATFAKTKAGSPPLSRALSPDAFEAYLRASLARYPSSYADRVVARAPRAEAYHYVAVPSRARQSGPLVAVFSAPPSADTLRTLERFAVLFALAYARHQDLQQAEVRARTSRLNAAVERARARALAMRGPEGLDDVIGVIVGELRRLGVPFHRCTVAAFDGATRGARYWSSTGRETTPADTVTVEGHPLYDALWVAWRTQQDLSYILEGEGLDAYLDRLRAVDPALADAHDAVDREYVYAVTVPAGVIVAFSAQPFSEDTVQAMQRMGTAFDAAYARHLDLQADEARAREAALSASVDRVRAEVASMRTADDLDRVTPRVWTELTDLGVPFVQCGVFIVDEAAGTVRALLATPDGEPLGALELPADGSPLIADVVAHWRRQATLAVVLPPERAQAWAATLADGGLDGSALPPGPLALRFAPFAQGLLYVGAPRPLSEVDGAAVQTLASAFEVAYARYADFQRLDARTHELEAALADLQAAQQRLVQSEKLASLGQLTAGIAHEIKNPLNFVNNFAALSRELAAELAAEVDGERDPTLIRELVDDLTDNARRIEQHGHRADAIVRAMMQHARSGAGERGPLDLDALVDEHVNLAYHGRRAQAPDFNVTLERDLGGVGVVEGVAQDLGRVVINLVSNAFDAVVARAAAEGRAFEPVVRIATAAVAGGVEIRVEDNGAGIPDEVRARVFEPFYTTKPAGKGTGLGLSMSHDIVEQGHGGRLTVESSGIGTTFVVALPAAPA